QHLQQRNQLPDQALVMPNSTVPFDLQDSFQKNSPDSSRLPPRLFFCLHLLQELCSLVLAIAIILT
ncbi:hypothetical protein NDU88_007322, partial [Pleurodeles waltl]